VKRALVLAFVAGAVLALAAAGRFYALVQPLTEDAPEQLFTVERGWGMSRVARALEDAGLVRSAPATEWYARASGLADQIKAGEYDLSPSWSVRTIVDRIALGRIKTYRVVIPEGLRASEIATRLEDAGLVDAAAFLKVAMDRGFAHSLGIEGESLEGYLFPETYHLPGNLSPEVVAQILVNQFQRTWQEIDPEARRRSMSIHDVVTLASIVEKETGAPEERPVIAAVFHNRLRKGMRLETDPSVIYGIPDFDGNLKKSHLLDRSNPYNTYQLAGLPPGPIASPGIDALRAVVEPASSDYLYFVSRNDGTHHFSRGYREHQNAVNRYQKRRGSR
jgi:UPF0755 protein